MRNLPRRFAMLLAAALLAAPVWGVEGRGPERADRVKARSISRATRMELRDQQLARVREHVKAGATPESIRATLLRRNAKGHPTGGYLVSRGTVQRYVKMSQEMRVGNWGIRSKAAPVEDACNAYYSRDATMVFSLYSQKHPGKTPKIRVSPDVIAHLEGHAILDSLKPQWLKSSRHLP